MEFKPFRAFGLVFILNTHEAGEKYKTVIKNPDCTIFCAEGFETCVNTETGEVMPDYETGWFHAPGVNYVVGTFDLEVKERTVIYCYDPKLNDGHDQKFRPMDIDGGSQTIFLKGTRLLLCAGEIDIEGKVFTAPAKISVESSDKLATILTRSLGLILI